MTPEKAIQSSIVSFFKELEKAGKPIFVERRQAGGYSYKMGIPDLYIVINGQHVEIEVKRPGGELRPMQVKFKEMCERRHIHYLCADNLDIVKEYIRINFDI